MRPYIVVKQIRASDLQPGDIRWVSFNDGTGNGEWLRWPENGVRIAGDPLALVDIQVEEPGPSIWPERWIPPSELCAECGQPAIREVDNRPLCAKHARRVLTGEIT